MESPLDPLVATIVNELDDNLREDFEERAGIIEFDGMLPRAHAECLALIDVLRRHPAVLTGVIVVRIELDGAPRWILTTDLNYVRNIGGVEIGVHETGAIDLAKVINKEFGGILMLTTVR